MCSLVLQRRVDPQNQIDLPAGAAQEVEASAERDARLLEKKTAERPPYKHTLHSMPLPADEVKDPLPEPEPASSKVEWRRWARHQRRSLHWNALSEQVRPRLHDLLTELAGSGALAESGKPVGEPPAVLAYRAMPGEIDLGPLIAADTRHRWYTTRTPSHGPLSVHHWHSPLERHRYGFDQPVAHAELVDPATIGIAVVPGLAFDRQGNRLGHGRGYYDVLLAQLAPPATLIGIGVDAVVVERLPIESHDVAVTHLVTESGWVQFPAS